MVFLSVDTVYKNLEKYPDIKVVIDLHRDAIGTDENKVKPVFTYNGKKGAQIMILAGCDTDGERGFDCWEENLNFALKIQDKAETLYPDMTRPLNFDYFAYNEYVCNGSLLIEVGTESNSIDEGNLPPRRQRNCRCAFKLTASFIFQFVKTFVNIQKTYYARLIL